MITCVALLLLLTGFEALPLGHYGTTYLQNVDAQRVRSQVFVKSALILEYHPAAERPQAINDIQVSLPLFIQEQKLLASNPNPNVAQKVSDAQSDYSAIVSATQSILAHPTGSIDPVQVDILVAHNHAFLIEETSVLTTIQANLQSAQFFLFVIEFVFDVLLCGLIIGYFVVFESMLRRQNDHRKDST